MKTLDEITKELSYNKKFVELPIDTRNNVINIQRNLIEEEKLKALNIIAIELGLMNKID